MRIKNWTFSQDICWEQLQALGVPRTYYELECWILANGLDPIIIKKLKQDRSEHDLLTLWRSCFITQLNNWSAYDGAREIADSLSMRCFVRIYKLNQPTPTGSTIYQFYQRNEKIFQDAMPFVSALWTATKRKNATTTWVQLMDTWSKRTMAGQTTLQEDFAT